MANKIIKNSDNSLSVRLDGAIIAGGKYLVEPFISADNKMRNFGSFRFVEEAEKDAIKYLKAAVNTLKPIEDTIFDGQYPIWSESIQYGNQLNVNNRVKFYEKINAENEIPANQIDDYKYALDLTISLTREEKLFVRVNRAIVMGNLTKKYNNDLFDEEDYFA